MLILQSVSNYFLAAILIASATCQSEHRFNPTIIQDSRLEPKVDDLIQIGHNRGIRFSFLWVPSHMDIRGTFGFLYRTEDGISHTAQGDPTGYIQGTYSYKDPTGLKVNFNYFAGAKKNSNSASAPAPEAEYRTSEPVYTEREASYRQRAINQRYYTREPESYEEPQEYRPRTRPPASYTRSQEYQPTYNSRYSSRKSPTLNEIYDVDDYQYRG